MNIGLYKYSDIFSRTVNFGPIASVRTCIGTLSHVYSTKLVIAAIQDGLIHPTIVLSILIDMDNIYLVGKAQE